MLGMIAQLMSIIENYCSFYHMYTDPNVYSYMWSIHPSIRDDRIYAHILMQMDERLAQLPWARTNRSLVNKTIGARSDLRRDFHAYPEWISGCLYEELEKYVDPDWFASTEIFDGNCIRQLSREIKSVCKGSFRPYDRWVRLAAFRMFAERCAVLGKRIEMEAEGCNECPDHSCMKPQDARSWLWKIREAA